MRKLFSRMISILLCAAMAIMCIPELRVFARVNCEEEGHDYYTEEGSCTEEIYVTWTCIYCGHSKVDLRGPIGHNYVEKITEATCIEPSYTSKVCSRCGYSYIVSSTGIYGSHAWDNGKVTTEPTVESEGILTFTCTLCGKTYIEEIPKLGSDNYTLRVVDMGGNPLSGGYVTISDTRYTLNSDGSVEIKNGPDAIMPLIVSAARDGGTREIYREECFFPIPNQVNTVVMYPEIDIEVNLLDKNADLSSSTMNGLPVDVAGKQFHMLTLDMTPELDLQLGDANVAFSYNKQTNLIEVIVSTEHLESAKADSWEKTWNAYVKGITEGKLPVTETKKVKFLGMEWDMSLGATLQIDYNMCTGSFRVVDGGGYISFEGEKRITKPFPIPAFYWTVAGFGGIEGRASAHATFNEVVNTAVAKMMAQISGTIGVEGALGIGVRPVANLYTEAGLLGKLDGSINFPFKSAKESNKLDFTGDFFVETRIWTLGDRLSWSLVDAQLWPAPEVAPANVTEDMHMTMLPRAYANESNVRMMRNDNNFISIAADAVADYPYSEMTIRQLDDGRYLLVYTDDDISRAAADRSVLRAVLGTTDEETGEIIWGQSMVIDDDGTGDFSFAVSVNDSKAAVVWQDMAIAFGEREDITTAIMAEYVDLSQAILDCSGNELVVEEVSAVTQDNGLCEGKPFTHYNGEVVRTAWVTSTENDPMVVSEEEEFTLWLDGGKVITTQQEISNIAILEQELLWSTQTETANDLWLRDSSGTVTWCEMDGIKDLQSRGDNFCFTEGESLYCGTGSYSTLREADSNAAYINTILLGDDGQVYFMENGLNAARLNVMRKNQAHPVAEFDGFVSCWDVAGGQVTALVKQGFASDDTSDDVAFLLCQAEERIYGSLENFTDVPAKGNWAYDGIAYCVEKGLMNGTGATSFNPNGTVSRAQLVTILYRAAGSPAVNTTGTFTDVPEGQWYSDAIEWAAENGVVQGIGNGKFGPDQSITREQIATILYRYEKEPAVTGNLNRFPDHGKVSPFAENALIWATQEELINGVSSNGVTTLAPQNNATRAQIASIFMRYLER